MSDDSDASNISSDSSDSNFFMDKPKINNTNFLEEIVPSYDDDKFFHHFRLSRESVDIIVENFEASEHYKDSSGQYGNISSRNQVLIVLWYIGHMSSFRDVANRFDITISSVHRILRRVVFTISNLAPSIITWPTNEEKIESERYFCQNGFPMVIGAIDGIHIKIDKPLEDSDCYKNKKGYYSIQMQAVCNHNRKIIDLFVGYPGSVNDSRVFRNSSLFNKLEEKCGNYFILADRGYPLKPNVLTPFKDKDF
ncbi:uncharacterized protein [Onthophagus taurus]|uniref:uncharacterized protein n=1 Tax=Onthophagus taurus TaxID=166361 RepID=UPI0039BE5A71